MLSHNSSTNLSVTEQSYFAEAPFPFVVTIDDSVSLGSSFNSSDLRQQLSHLNVNSATSACRVSTSRNPTSIPANTEKDVYVPYENQTNLEVWTSYDEVQTGLPKPKIYQRHRRKQEFKILRSPSDELRDSVDDTQIVDARMIMKNEEDGTTNTNQKLIVDRQCDNIFEMFDCHVEVLSSDSNLNTKAVSSSSPLAVDVNLLRTPDNRVNDDENEDDNLMLFTPFRGGETNIYASLSVWPSPIRYLNSFTPIAESLGAVLLSPEREAARTSTPFEISGVDRTPEKKCLSSSKTLFQLTPTHVDYLGLTPDFNVHGFDSPLGSTPGLWEAPFGDRSPPEIRFHSPTIKRLLSGCEDRGDEQISLADISHALNFSPSR